MEALPYFQTQYIFGCTNSIPCAKLKLSLIGSFKQVLKTQYMRPALLNHMYLHLKYCGSDLCALSPVLWYHTLTGSLWTCSLLVCPGSTLDDATTIDEWVEQTYTDHSEAYKLSDGSRVPLFLK